MKARAKIVIIIFIVGVLTAGALINDIGNKKRTEVKKIAPDEKAVITNIAKELMNKGVVLQNYYLTTNTSLEKAFGIKINKQKLVFTIIDIPAYNGTISKVNGVINLADSVFRYDRRADGIVVLFIEPNSMTKYLTFIYIDRVEFLRNKQKGLENIALYNTFEFFNVPKASLVKESKK
ncbi:hypothetical protein IPdc08_00394 [archaeon]|nr:hypothetical protein IPdc08_00394 [archaeon]